MSTAVAGPLAGKPLFVVPAGPDTLAYWDDPGQTWRQVTYGGGVGGYIRWVPYTGPPQTFAAGDMTRDGDWTMTANKATSARPAPQATGPETDLLPPTWAPTVQNARASYTVYNEWTTNTGGWVEQYGANVIGAGGIGGGNNVGAQHVLTLSVNGIIRDTFTAIPSNAGMYWHDIAPIVVASGAVLRVTLQVTQVGNNQMDWEQQTGLFATAPPLTSLAVGSKDGAAAGTTAYGTHLLFTPGTASPDWDIVAFGGAAAGGGQTGGPAATGAPNKLINPFMEIDQEHEGATVTINGAVANVIDGIGLNTTLNTTSQRSPSAPTGYSNSVAVSNTNVSTVVASTLTALYQNIEARELIDTAFGTASAKTLSFAAWAGASIAGTYAFALANDASNRSFVIPFTLPANSFQLITATIPGDTAGTWTTSGNGVGMSLIATQVAGSGWQTATANAWVAGNYKATTGISNAAAGTAGALFYLGPWGLWVSPSPPPLLRTSIQAELARCQRYYEKTYDPGTALGTATTTGAPQLIAQTGQGGQTPMPFKVTKRVVPTVTIYSPATGASGVLRNYTSGADIAAAVSAPGLNGIGALASASNAAAASLYAAHWTADARL
jgi:hypothetical protein